MATKGEKLRDRVRRIISSENKRSTATLTKYTYTKGDKGGYDETTETLSTTSTIYCIPEAYSRDVISSEMMGDIKAGDLQLLIRDDVTIDFTALTDYELTFQSLNYKINDLKPIFFNDVVIAQVISLSKELTQ